MKLRLRAYNDRGIEAAIDFLEGVRRGDYNAVPRELLEDPDLSKQVGGEVRFALDAIETRWQFAAWLYREIGRALEDTAALRQPGFWTWLALACFDILRPAGKKVGEDARYVLRTDDFRKRYRNLVSGPYFVFAAHEGSPQILRAVLATAPNAPGDLYEQIASRQELITSASVMECTTRMYWDFAEGKLRSGASSNARRLAEVLMQYQVTYDFGAIPPEALLEMLPREFRRFKPKEMGGA